MLVATEKRGEQLAVVSALKKALPFRVGRNPRAVPFPAMQIGQTVSADLIRRKARRDRDREVTFVLVQCLVRGPVPGTWRTDTPFREFEAIALSQAPSLDRSLRNDHSQ